MAPSLLQVYNDALSNRVNGAMQNTLLASIVIVLTFLYTAQLRPHMPPKFDYIFSSLPVRIILLSLGLSLFNRNPPLSFVLVSAVIGAIHLASAVEAFELLNPEVLLVDPNCEDVTYDDLLKSFDGDVDALETFARTAGLPLSKPVKDHVPLVASLMMQSGIPVTLKCSNVYEQASYENTIL